MSLFLLVFYLLMMPLLAVCQTSKINFEIKYKGKKIGIVTAAEEKAGSQTILNLSTKTEIGRAHV